MAFKSVELFGGAIITEVPANFIDVSKIRVVPDHQEVYLDQDGFTSIIFEILERVDKPDQEALAYHLEDVVEGDASETKLITTADAHFSQITSGNPAYTLLATAPPSEKQRGRDNEADFIAIYLTMLRLVEKQTDLLIAINVPFIAGKYEPSSINQDAGQLGVMGDSAHLVREKILQTFSIKDWSLFGED